MRMSETIIRSFIFFKEQTFKTRKYSFFFVVVKYNTKSYIIIYKILNYLIKIN